MEQAILSADAVHDHDAQYPHVLESIQANFSARVGDPASRLYTTDVEGLWGVYLDALPSDRQYHTCHCCRQFIERFGGLVTLDAHGVPRSAIWHTAVPGDFYASVIAAMQERVESAKVTGVFYSSDKVWGQPVTGPWTHFSVVPPSHLVHKDRVKTAYQASAEKLEDYKTMITALQEFALPTVETAIALLKTDSLYRSEKCLGVAEWLRDLIVARDATKNGKTKANLLWRAVATAPIGFAHPRSSMIGTLLEDIATGLGFEDVKAKFAAKMHPLQYQRPQAAPTAGAIAAAEKLVEQMGIAPSLERRFARLDDLQKLWVPIEPIAQVAKGSGVFGHLQTKGATVAPDIKVPVQTMTWDKFSRTVLPEAERIEILIPSHGNFAAYLTAQNPDAPPILQWDRGDRRNPVSWYLYNGGSTAARWCLASSTWGRVTAISAQSSAWFEENAHQGNGVMFVIDGAKDREYEYAGNALFPETLKSDLHPVRSVIEAYSKKAKIHGFDEASACGLLFSKGGGRAFQANRIRVTAKGTTLEYSLDRWD
jgi:hypothetical protein